MNELKEATVGDQKMMAVEDETRVPVLGRFFWTTIGKMLVPIEDLGRLFDELRIPREYFPKPPRAIDCFKIATKEQESNEYLVEDEETIDKGVKKKNSRCRLFVSRVHDVKTESLPIIGKWVFKDDTISQVTVDEDKRDAFLPASQKVDARYTQLKTSFTDKDIRDMLRVAINKMHPTMMRPSGAVYFVLEENRDLLTKFSNLITMLNEKYGTSEYISELTTIPILDTKKMRELVTFKFTGECLGKIEEMLPAIVEILKDESKEIVPSQYKNYIDTLNYIKESKEKYAQVLGFLTEKVDVQLQILEQQLLQLAERVKHEET